MINNRLILQGENLVLLIQKHISQNELKKHNIYSSLHSKKLEFIMTLSYPPHSSSQSAAHLPPLCLQERKNFLIFNLEL